MDEAQKEKAAAWIGSHINPSCPSCDRPGPFQIVDELVAPPLIQDGAMNLTACLPLVALVCTSCGNVRLFSAIVVGLLPPAHAQADSHQHTVPRVDIR